MDENDDTARPVEAKAFIVDPESLKITWSNESVARSLPPGVDIVSKTAALAHVVPRADELDAAGAVRQVARTGEPRHLGTGLVSTARGALDVVVSIYRLPGGEVLVLLDSTYQPRRGRA